mmetsp:Transcript_11328/g.27212  ORF Transcript_11328/g.27212 Transcript_11328/m.27212 type:complete len:109 (+) Transcript_11328:334-660(+)
MPRALLKAVYSGVSRANQLLQQMFQVLQEVAAPAEAPAPAATGYRSNMANGGIPKPPPSYIAPVGSSYMTWPNVYSNLKNIDYCVDQFNMISNRIKCINAFTHGPFLD